MSWSVRNAVSFTCCIFCLKDVLLFIPSCKASTGELKSLSCISIRTFFGKASRRARGVFFSFFFFSNDAEQKTKPHSDEVQNERRANGAHQELSVLRWGSTCSQLVFQRASLCQTRQSRVHSFTGNQGSLIEFLLLTAFFFFSMWRAAGFSAASCQNTDLHRTAHPSPRGPNRRSQLENSHLSSERMQCNIW